MAQVTSGSVSTNSVSGYGLTTSFRLDWSATQSIQNNQSTISWSLTTVQSPTGSGYQRTIYTSTYVTIDGTTVNLPNQTSAYNGLVIMSGTKVITHNSDGTKSFSISVGVGVGSTTINCSGSDTFELKTIPRYTSITNFTIDRRSETSLIFNWATADEIDYLWYSTDGGNNWVDLDVADGTSGSFVVDDLSPRTPYRCRINVRRKDSQLTTLSSTKTQTTYGIPSQQVSDITETSVNVSWNIDSDADYIWYSFDNSNWIDVGVVSGTSGNFTINNLAPSASYSLYLRIKRQAYQTISSPYFKPFSTYDYPHATTTPDFTIGDGVWIGLYNPLGRDLYVIMYCQDGSIAYEGSGWTGDSIGDFAHPSITTPLYNSIPNSVNGKYTMLVRWNGVEMTTQGGVYSINYDNSKPIFNDFTYSTNYSELTGNNDTIINGETTTTFTISFSNKAVGNNGASISKYRYKCGNQSYEIAYSDNDITVSIPNCDNQNIEITAIDSRGLEKSVSKIISNFKDYYKPSFASINTERDDGVEATTKLNFRVNYWNNNFGAGDNMITYVDYRRKLTTASEWSERTPITLDNISQSDGIATLTDYLIHANGSSGGFEIGKAYNIEVLISDGISSYWFSYVSAYTNVTDGKVSVSVLQDNNGDYHVGVNGMPDLTKNVMVHGNTKLKGQLELSYTSDIYWKEDGWGDKFDIVPQFGGSGDDNKLLIRGAVGDAGTDPDLYTLVTISAQTGYTWFKGHVETSERFIIPKADGKGIYNSSGYPIIRDFNNGNITVDGTGNALFLGFQNTNEINILADRAWVRSDGSFQSPAGFYSYDAGYVNTPTNTGKLLIKKAHYNPDGTPNNGVVLQYGEYNEWNGQLFIGDNYEQGVWFNGWSNGVRGTWKKLAFEDNETFELTADSNVTKVYDALIGKKNGNTIHLYGTFDLNSYAWGTKIANSKYKPSISLRFVVSCGGGYACLYIDAVGDIYYLYGDNGSVFLNTTFVL